MKIALMGAGYVGMEFLKDLNQEIEFITTTTSSRVDFLRPYCKKVVVLGTNADRPLRDLVHKSDVLVILVAPKNSSEYENTYLQTAKNINLLSRGRNKPLRMVYTSSTAVYEQNQQGWVTEESVLSPTSIHANLLIETEKQYLADNPETCILRLGGIYGPNRELEKRAVRLSSKEMHGTGNEATNHIHLKDIVNALKFCIKNELKGIYNLVNDAHPSRNILYNTLCKEIDIPPPIWSLSDEKIRGYKVANKKIKNTGFIFTHTSLDVVA